VDARESLWVKIWRDSTGSARLPVGTLVRFKRPLRSVSLKDRSWPIVRIQHPNRKQPFAPRENNQTSINHEGV